MSIVRFNPFGDLGNLQHEVNRIFDNFPGFRRDGDEGFESAVWRPRVDIHETPESYIIDAELPGVKKEEVTLNFQDGTISIAGERRYEYDSAKNEGDGEVQTTRKSSSHRIERRYGKFYRSFTLPTAVNADGIKAKFENGILNVTVPKVEEVKPRAISVE